MREKECIALAGELLVNSTYRKDIDKRVKEQKR
jgi:hypothetical protein